MKILLILDSPESLTPDMDTSLLIAKESCLRGHKVFYTEPQQLWLENNIPFCLSSEFDYTGGDVQESLSILKPNKIDEFDLVLMRKDPPVDDLYISVTYILDYASIPVINSPSSLRNINEKIIIGTWPQFIPDSYVFGDLKQVLSFLNNNKEKKWVIKPLNLFNGTDIFKIWHDYDNVEDIIKYMFNKNSFIIVQKFMKNVSTGDKKIFILGDKILGAMNRVPSKDDFRANIHLGAKPENCILNKKEKNISEKVASFLVKNGVHLACIDIIDNKLTEVNVTSPSGIPEINRVTGNKLETNIVDYLEQILQGV